VLPSSVKSGWAVDMTYVYAILINYTSDEPFIYVLKMNAYVASVVVMIS
jgi:hypothetical protein